MRNRFYTARSRSWWSMSHQTPSIIKQRVDSDCLFWFPLLLISLLLDAILLFGVGIHHDRLITHLIFFYWLRLVRWSIGLLWRWSVLCWMNRLCQGWWNVARTRVQWCVTHIFRLLCRYAEWELLYSCYCRSCCCCRWRRCWCCVHESSTVESFHKRPVAFGLLSALCLVLANFQKNKFSSSITGMGPYLNVTYTHSSHARK